MAKVVYVRIDVLKVDDCISLFSKTAEIAEECFGFAGGEFACDFIRKYGDFRQALSGESTATFKAMYSADIATDEVWRGLNDEIRAGQRHPNPARREANNVVSEVFGHYEDPTQLPYSEEYGRLRQLIEELEALPESTLKAAVVDEWVVALRSRYEAFMEASRVHMLEASFGDIGGIKRERVSASNAYRSLVDRACALSDMPEREDCRQFVEKLNNYLMASPYGLQATRRDRRSLIG